ncbi:THAP domain-containing protein 2 isoform X2 [Ooceraea biroi]|uniref:THAP domain-containing protein 2 isoform X2 n=1 Tax=Ooceraea biroi TaxID=2015173 RepID=UPI000F093056|nr:THAP domain-containing protein 2 isoform X2 [Ooceraea biroi]
MPGCSAGYCTNSSAKGYKMFKFPQDPKKRQKWIENMLHTDQTPGKYFAYCEVHFVKEMFTITASGQLRLKPNAVPTIFGPSSQLPMQNTDTLEKLTDPKEPMMETDSLIENEENCSATVIQDDLASSKSDDSDTFEKPLILLQNKNGFVQVSQDWINKMETIFIRNEKLKRKLKYKLDVAQRKIKRLQKCSYHLSRVAVQYTIEKI